MNHGEAIRIMGTEQYLLNELSPELREQFEEHFFDCPECAADVRAGALLLEQTNRIFAGEAAAPRGEVPAVAAAKPGWLAWLRPAFAAPALALLLAIVVYQNWPTRQNPQVLQAAYVTIGSRGGSVPTVSASQGQGFLLRINVPQEQSYTSYFADIYGPEGKIRSSVNLPVSAGNDTYFVQMPGGIYNDGVYYVAIRGVGPDGNSIELGRGSFELHISR
jgi:putative zinc finger protein